MKLTAFTILFGLTLVAGLAGCADPSDPVAVGQICLPANDRCPSEIGLFRPTEGRNALEITVTNLGDDATFELQVTTDDDLDLPGPSRHNDQGSLILVESSLPLGPDETLRESYSSRELAVASALHLRASCPEQDCRLQADYIYFVEPVECYDDGVCSRDEFCEISLGRCSECSEDLHCSAHQTCDLETGNCFPRNTTGCQHHESTPPPAALLFVLGALAIVLFHRRTRTATTVILLVFLLIPSAFAATPSVSFSAGGGLRLLTAEPGRLTRPGWGIALQQQLQFGRFGTNFRITTHSFSLHDESIPNELRLSGYTVGLGPRAFFQVPLTLPFSGPELLFDIFLGIDYTRWMVSQNRIAHVTGLALSYHAAGPTLGAIWRWAGLKLMAQSNYSTIFGWPGGVVSFDLTVGIAR